MFLNLLHKKRKNGWKALYIRKKKKGITRNVYNEIFIVSPESQGKKRKNSYVWRSFQDTKMLKLMNNFLKQETEEP